MKKIMKKVISFLLSMSMLSSFAVMANAEDNYLTNVTFGEDSATAVKVVGNESTLLGTGWTVTDADNTLEVINGRAQNNGGSDYDRMFFTAGKSEGVWEFSMDIRKPSQYNNMAVVVSDEAGSQVGPNRYSILHINNYDVYMGRYNVIQNNANNSSLADYTSFKITWGTNYTFTAVINKNTNKITLNFIKKDDGAVLGTYEVEIPEGMKMVDDALTSTGAMNLGDIYIQLLPKYYVDNISVKEYTEQAQEMTASDITLIDENDAEISDISKDTGNSLRKIKVNFANPVSEDIAQSIKLYAGSTEITDYTLAAEANTVTLTLNNALAPSTAHKLVVANTAKSYHGFDLLLNASDFEYSFTTTDGTKPVGQILTSVTFGEESATAVKLADNVSTLMGPGWTVSDDGKNLEVVNGYVYNNGGDQYDRMNFAVGKDSGVWEISVDITKPTQYNAMEVTMADTSGSLANRFQLLKISGSNAYMGKLNIIQNNASGETGDYVTFGISYNEPYTFKAIVNKDTDKITTQFIKKSDGTVLKTYAVTIPDAKAKVNDVLTSTGAMNFGDLLIYMAPNFNVDNILVQEYKEAQVLMSEDYITMYDEDGEEIVNKSEHTNNRLKKIDIDLGNTPETVDGKIKLYKLSGSEWSEVSTVEGSLNGNVYTMYLTARPQGETTYKIVVANDMVSLQGNKLFSNTEAFEYEFTTGEASAVLPEVTVLETVAGPLDFESLGALAAGNGSTLKSYMNGLNMWDGGNAAKMSTASVGTADDTSVALTFATGGSNVTGVPMSGLKATSGTYEFKARALKSASDDRLWIYMSNSYSTKTHYAFCASADGNTYLGNSGAMTNVGTTETGVWYDITATFFIDTAQYRITVKEGDTVIADNLMYTLPTGTKFGSIYIDGTDGMYVDDISITKTDEKLYVKPNLTKQDITMYNFAGEAIEDITAHELADVDKINLYFADKVVNPEDTIKLEKLDASGNVAEEISYTGEIVNYVNYQLDLPLLSGNTTYRLTVGKDISNGLGQIQGADYVLEFTTGDAVCDVAIEGIYADGVKIDGVEDITASTASLTAKADGLNCTADAANVAVIIAYYNNNRLVSTETKDISFASATDALIETSSFAIPTDLSGITEIKVFAWDSQDGMVPYCAPAVLPKN